MHRCLLYFLIVTLAAVPSLASADIEACQWQDDFAVSREGDEVLLRQRSDDDSHRLRVEIWGSEQVALACHDLDGDEQPEVLITSRGIGSGPYYRLQIIAFRAEGIQTWSYPSTGKPYWDEERVYLGKRLHGASGTAVPDFRGYVYTTEYGLVNRFRDVKWLQFISLRTADGEMTLQGPDFPSQESCTQSGEQLKRRASSTETGVSIQCIGNAELGQAMEAITN